MYASWLQHHQCIRHALSAVSLVVFGHLYRWCTLRWLIYAGCFGHGGWLINLSPGSAGGMPGLRSQHLNAANACTLANTCDALCRLCYSLVFFLAPRTLRARLRRSFFCFRLFSIFFSKPFCRQQTPQTRKLKMRRFFCEEFSEQAYADPACSAPQPGDYTRLLSAGTAAASAADSLLCLKGARIPLLPGCHPFVFCSRLLLATLPAVRCQIAAGRCADGARVCQGRCSLLVCAASPCPYTVC